MTVSRDDVAAVLANWIGHQRWYAGKSREATFTAWPLATLADASAQAEIWVAQAQYADTSERYQVPLLFAEGTRENLDHAYVGSVNDVASGSPVQIYDALYDHASTALWLHGLTGAKVSDDVQFTAIADAADIPVDQTSMVMTAEQSNTSLIYGDVAIMKVFRRIEPGLNPDIEVHAELSRLGGRHIARLLGHVSVELDGQVWSLAMVQEFMRTATDGWQLATGSVRDLMAEADLHAEEAGGDFAAESFRLGTATAEVHVDLASAFGVAPLSREELAARAAAMHARLDAALVEVPALAAVEQGLRHAYDELGAYTGPVTAQRVHGDLHLGQVLRTVHRWVMLDFEGEPAKSISERQGMDSPLRDVAGMLRSFDYAARHQLVDLGATPQSEFRAAEWAARNRVAFSQAYAEAGGLDPAGAEPLLRAFEADKAVYEAVYEARNRPHWLAIPLASLQRLATAEEVS